MKHIYNPDDYHISAVVQKNRSIKWGFGIKTGLITLDHETGGLKPGMTYCIAAYRKNGLSAFIYTLVSNLGVQRNCSVALFSYNSSSWNILNALVAQKFKIDIEEIRRNKLTDLQQNLIEQFYDEIVLQDIFIYADDHIPFNDMRQQATLLANEKNVDCVIIEDPAYFNANHLSSIKSLAIDLNIPIVISTYLGDWKQLPPALSDFESIDQFSRHLDTILLLYRPEHYNIVEWEDGTSTKDQMRVIIAKNRFGKTSEIMLGCNYDSYGIIDFQSIKVNS